MSQYFFGLWTGKVSDAWVEAADAVAKRHDAYMVTYPDPASGPRGWMCGPNYGAPFDARMAAAVLDDLTAEDLWDGAPVEPA